MMKMERMRSLINTVSPWCSKTIYMQISLPDFKFAKIIFKELSMMRRYFQIIVSVFLAKLSNARTRKEKGEIKAGIS